jgi:hypothetical protein
MTLREIVEQLQSCNYECEAGPLENNVAFVDLQRLADQTTMNFGQALEEVKQGKGMRLPQWQPDVVIRAQYPDEHSKMTAPYLYVESRFGKVPWKETMIELFSEKWEVVE